MRNRATNTTLPEWPEEENPIAALPEETSGRVTPTFMPILVEEAAQIVFDYWEREAVKQNGSQLIGWRDLDPKYQVMWCRIIEVIIKMGATVVLTDAMHYIRSHNGDIGNAMATAVASYAHENGIGL